MARLRQVDVKAEHFERQVQRLEQERDQWEQKFEVRILCLQFMSSNLCPASFVDLHLMLLIDLCNLALVHLNLSHRHPALNHFCSAGSANEIPRVEGRARRAGGEHGRTLRALHHSVPLSTLIHLILRPQGFPNAERHLTFIIVFVRDVSWPYTSAYTTPRPCFRLHIILQHQ